MSDFGSIEPAASAYDVHEDTRNPKSEIRNPVMKISLGSWAFSFGPFAGNPIPFEKTVERLSSAGYDGIEICGFPPHVTLDKYPTVVSRNQLVRFLADHKLGVSGYAADFTSVNPVAPGNKQKYLDLFQRNAEMRSEEHTSELQSQSNLV